MKPLLLCSTLPFLWVALVATYRGLLLSTDLLAHAQMSQESSPVAYQQSGFYFLGTLNQERQESNTSATTTANSSNYNNNRPAAVNQPLEGDFVEVAFNGDGPIADGGSGTFAYAGGWVTVEELLNNSSTQKKLMLVPGNSGSTTSKPVFQDPTSPGTTVDGGFTWPSSSVTGTSAGFVLHPSGTLWFTPWPASNGYVFAAQLSDSGGSKTISQYSLPVSGRGTGYYAGGCVHNDDVWMMPTNSPGDPVLRIQLAGTTTPQLSYPASISDVGSATSGVFNGAVYDGASMWMIPYAYTSRLVRFDLSEMQFVQRPFGTLAYSGASGGGVYDGASVWMGPRDSGVVLKIDAGARTATTLSDWPTGVQGSGFNNALFDSKYVWLIPLFGSALVRIDAASGAMKGFLLGSDIRGSTEQFCQGPVLDSVNQMLHLGLASGKIVSLKFSTDGVGEPRTSGSSVLLGNSEEKGLSQGALLGIIFGCIGGTMIVIFVILMCACRGSSEAPTRGDSQHQVEPIPSNRAHANEVGSEPVLGVPVVATTPGLPQSLPIYSQAPLGYPSSTPPPKYPQAEDPPKYSNPCTPPDDDYTDNSQQAGGGGHEFGEGAAPHVEIIVDDQTVQPTPPPSYGVYAQQQQQTAEAFSAHNCDRSLALVPCGHAGACRQCAGSALDKFCPQCGTRIEGVAKPRTEL